jgi:hypothetical protein
MCSEYLLFNNPVANKQKELAMTTKKNASATFNKALLTAGNCITKTSEFEHLSIEDVINVIRTGTYLKRDLIAPILAIRKEKAREDAAKIKKALPFFTGSFFEISRCNANVCFACFAIIDLDHVPDIPATKNLIMERFPYAVCAFRSVNDGVKIVISLKPIEDEAHFRATYAILMQRIEDITGIKPDSTPDWARACFFSYDPDLLFNEGYLSFSCELPPSSAPPFSSNIQGSNHIPSLANASEDDFYKAELVIKTLSVVKLPYQDWIKTGLALKAAFGERGKALWLLYADNPHYNDDAAALERKWKSFRGSGAAGIGSIFYIGGKHGIC